MSQKRDNKVLQIGMIDRKAYDWQQRSASLELFSHFCKMSAYERFYRSDKFG